MSLETFEAARGGPFQVQWADGSVSALPSAHDLSLGVLLDVIDRPMAFAHVCDVPETTYGVLLALQGAWSAHHGLTSLQDAQRLMMLLERYGTEIEVDLLAHPAALDLGTEWRARRWRRLLNVIDHLPRTSWYWRTAANDDEYAEALAKAFASQPQRDESEDTGPDPTTWSPEVETLTALVNEVRMLRGAFIAANTSGNKAPELPLSKGPITKMALAIQKQRREEWEAKHKSVVARLLPENRGSG